MGIFYYAKKKENLAYKKFYARQYMYCCGFYYINSYNFLCINVSSLYVALSVYSVVIVIKWKYFTFSDVSRYLIWDHNLFTQCHIKIIKWALLWRCHRNCWYVLLYVKSNGKFHLGNISKLTSFWKTCYSLQLEHERIDLTTTFFYLITICMQHS